MKIVDVCAYFVNNPVSGGQARVFGFNKALSKHAIVEQFSFTPVIMRKKSFRYSKNYSEHIYPSLFYTKGIIALKILGILNYDFLIPFIFRFKRMPKQMKKAIEEADIVQVEHPWLMGWITNNMNKNEILKKPIVLVEHNIESELQKEFFKGKIFQKRIVKSIRRTEQEAVKKAKLVFAMCQEDSEKLSRLYGVGKNKIAVVPNGAMLKNHTSKLTKEEARRKLGLKKNSSIVLFVGARHPPNNDAAAFIERVLAPKMADITFLIVGNVRSEREDGNVICTGAVDELDDYYSAADIAINPMIDGSGTNLKMFSYFASGLPVVTTKKGLRGIEAKPGKDVIVSDIDGFSESITTLINDRQLQANLRRGGRKIAERHDWGVIAREAIEHYNKLL